MIGNGQADCLDYVDWHNLCNKHGDKQVEANPGHPHSEICKEWVGV